MRIPLLRGRNLSARDDLHHERVAYFSHVDPIGKQILEDYDAQKNFYRIVGVTGDARRESPDIPPEPDVLFPLGQIGPDALETGDTGLAIRWL